MPHGKAQASACPRTPDRLEVIGAGRLERGRMRDAFRSPG
jgi:hypothetical protein